jgi:hypothetical protein
MADRPTTELHLSWCHLSSSHPPYKTHPEPLLLPHLSPARSLLTRSATAAEAWSSSCSRAAQHRRPCLFIASVNRRSKRKHRNLFDDGELLRPCLHRPIHVGAPLAAEARTIPCLHHCSIKSGLLCLSSSSVSTPPQPLASLSQFSISRPSSPNRNATDLERPGTFCPPAMAVLKKVMVFTV